jgi:hypothetical protein
MARVNLSGRAIFQGSLRGPFFFISFQEIRTWAAQDPDFTNDGIKHAIEG